MGLRGHFVPSGPAVHQRCNTGYPHTPKVDSVQQYLGTRRNTDTQRVVSDHKRHEASYTNTHINTSTYAATGICSKAQLEASATATAAWVKRGACGLSGIGAHRHRAHQLTKPGFWSLTKWGKWRKMRELGGTGGEWGNIGHSTRDVCCGELWRDVVEKNGRKMGGKWGEMGDTHHHGGWCGCLDSAAQHQHDISPFPPRKPQPNPPCHAAFLSCPSAWTLIRLAGSKEPKTEARRDFPIRSILRRATPTEASSCASSSPHDV